MKKARKLLSLILCLVLMLCLFPAAFAEGGEQEAIAPAAEADREDEGNIAPIEHDPAGADAPGGPEGDPSTRPDGLAQDDKGDGPDAIPAADELQEETSSGECGENLTWSFDNGVLTISGTGAMTDWSKEEEAPWHSYRASVTDLVLPVGLTGIGSEAFASMSSLTGVTIPESVTVIGVDAFWDSGLRSVTVPAGVVEIQDDAFADCSGLQEILVAEGNGNYTSLDGVLYDAAIRLIIQCPGGKTGEMKIPESVTEIRQVAFYGCSGLESVAIPPIVNYIGAYTFYDCSSLESITIPPSVNDIGIYAFYGCSSLTSVEIPEGVARIRGGTFMRCSSLKSVKIPSSVTSIAMWAFKDCSVLSDLELPERLESIGWRAFENCNSLTSVTIPSSMTIIGESAFESCGGLTSVTIKEGVTAIDEGAFWGCAALPAITIPASVTSIAGSAFRVCLSLKTICFLGDVPDISDEAFVETGRNVPHVALYPADNATWTSDKLQNYGAEKLNWVGYRNEPMGYTVHFDPNGGSNAPADQLKGHDVDLALTSDEPTRVGYTFLGWAEDAAVTEAAYAPGAVYSSNRDVTLYAIWQQIDPEQLVVDGGTCGDDLTWVYYETGTLKILGTGAMTDYKSWSRAPWKQYKETITDIVLPEGLTTIGAYAFYECEKVTDVAIPEGVTKIGGVAFGRCDSLQNVVIPESVTSIEEFAFDSCYNLANVTIPNGVTTIGTYTFFRCFGLERFEIPANVTSIEYGAFEGCSFLTEIRFRGAAPSMEDDCFCDVTATAYYPANDPSWTEEVRQNYGGSITWVSYEPETELLPGDMNGDGRVDNKDVTRLIRYIKYGDVEVVEAALDVNGDGEVNNKDVTRLIRYIKYGDVEIH